MVFEVCRILGKFIDDKYQQEDSIDDIDVVVRTMVMEVVGIDIEGPAGKDGYDMDDCVGKG